MDNCRLGWRALVLLALACIFWTKCRRTGWTEVRILTTDLLLAAIRVVEQAIIGYVLAFLEYQHAGGMKVTKRRDDIIRRNFGWSIWSGRRVQWSYLFLGCQRCAENSEQEKQQSWQLHPFTPVQRT